MTFKDKAKWFSFEMSFVLAQSYAYAYTCAYARAYVDAYVGCTLRWIFLLNLLSFLILGLCLRLVKTRLVALRNLLNDPRRAGGLTANTPHFMILLITNTLNE